MGLKASRLPWISLVLALGTLIVRGHIERQIPDAFKSPEQVDRWQKSVNALLREADVVFTSSLADGLNLVPFAALVDEGGRYVVEGHTLTYLTSGRDLLRLQAKLESRQPPLAWICW